MGLQMKLISIFGLVLTIACSPAKNGEGVRSEGYIYSVHGKVSIDELGKCLTHEHVMSIFGGESRLIPDYNESALFEQVVPYLKKVKSLGINTIFDCTAAYFGRDVKLLKALADSSDLQIITNTGLYGAAKDRYVPEYAFQEITEHLAQRWISEFKDGIQGTQIRPGFVKLAFDGGEPSDIDLKLFEAGVICHKKTGLTLVTHTGNNPKAVAAQLKLMEKHRVHPSAWVWTHAQKVQSPDTLLAVAELGGWISLDGARIRRKEEDTLRSINKHLDFLLAFKAKNLLNKVLLSHDGNSFPRGRSIRTYEDALLHLIPRMKEVGFTNDDIDQIMVRNPRNAFAIRIRKQKNG